MCKDRDLLLYKESWHCGCLNKIEKKNKKKIIMTTNGTNGFDFADKGDHPPRRSQENPLGIFKSCR